jgi:hypothetical protein
MYVYQHKFDQFEQWDVGEEKDCIVEELQTGNLLAAT